MERESCFSHACVSHCILYVCERFRHSFSQVLFARSSFSQVLFVRSWRQSVCFACGLLGTCSCKTGESGCFSFWLAASGGVAKPLARPQAGMANDVVIHRPRKRLRAKDDHSRVIGICNRKFEPPGLLESLSMFAGPW